MLELSLLYFQYFFSISCVLCLLRQRLISIINMRWAGSGMQEAALLVYGIMYSVGVTVLFQLVTPSYIIYTVSAQFIL